MSSVTSPRKYLAYSPELGRRICAMVRQGYTPVSLSEMPDMPHYTTLRRWRLRHRAFAEAWAKACAGRRAVWRRLHSAKGGPRAKVAVYSLKWADHFCIQLLDGFSVLELSRRPGMPSYARIHHWLNVHPEFRKRYRIACAMRDDSLAGEVMDLAGPFAAGFAATGALRARLGALALKKHG